MQFMVQRRNVCCNKYADEERKTLATLQNTEMYRCGVMAMEEAKETRRQGNECTTGPPACHGRPPRKKREATKTLKRINLQSSRSVVEGTKPQTSKKSCERGRPQVQLTNKNPEVIRRLRNWVFSNDHRGESDRPLAQSSSIISSIRRPRHLRGTLPARKEQKIKPKWENWQFPLALLLCCRTAVAALAAASQQRRQKTPLQLLRRMLKSLVSIFIILLLFPALKFTAAGCRDEESRACEAICSAAGNATDPTNCTIRALVLLPDNDMYVASMRRVLPILQVAVHKLHESQLLPPYITFDWLPHDDKCDAAYAVIQAMDGIVKNCAHVIFGPVCDYPLASVSRITKYMNSHGTPLISIGGSTYDFEMKKTTCADEFYMLVRTGTISFETISEMTIAVMKRNNWSHSVFFYDRDGQNNVAGLHTCYLMMNSLGKQMRKENMTFAQYPINTQVKNRTEEMRREIGNKHSSKKCFRY